MSSNQQAIKFDGGAPRPAPASPQGYKGLSGFHKYWGKKPTEAWRFLIENLTDRNDIVLDPFLGSGLIAKECTDLHRRFIGFDVNPISIALTRLYLELPSHAELSRAIAQIEQAVKLEINAMYQLPNGSIATHFLWDGEAITKIWTKNGRKRVELEVAKAEVEKLQNMPAYRPKHTRKVRLFDNSRISSKKSFSLQDLFAPRALRAIDLLKEQIVKLDGRVKAALLLVLSASLGQMSKMVFAVSNRGKTQGRARGGLEVGSWVIGYWRPEQHFEINAWNCFENKARKLLTAIKEGGRSNGGAVANSLERLLSDKENAYIAVGDSERLLQDIPPDSVKVVLTDPPHGDRIPYLELSEMWNSVIGLDANYAAELVVSNAKERAKDLSAYNGKLSTIFTECSRVLARGGLMAVMFNARAKDYWSSLSQLEKTSQLDYIGCYPMAYSAGSVAQDNRKGGLKTDYVLIYGKKMDRTRRRSTEHIFSMVNDWSVNYPAEA